MKSLEKPLVKEMAHMTQEKNYKLGQYKVIEGSDGGLWWESHTGLGSSKRGKCIIEGDFLIIGPTEVEQSGFLKGEFMELLDKLPAWQRTKYYCSSNAICECNTNRKMVFSARKEKYLNTSSNMKKKDSISEISKIKKETSKQRGLRKNLIKMKDQLAEVWRALRD